MKKALLIFLVAIIGFQAQAQETKTKKELRAEKKEQEIKAQADTRKLQEKWVDDKTFVLEAMQVFNKEGMSFQMNSSTNFVYVNEDKAVIQLAFDGIAGWNGVGGITVKGRITRYEVDKENPNKPIYIKMSIQGPTGFQDIALWVSSSGQGEAQVTDNQGNRIRLTGNILSLEESSVFVGMETF